MELLDVSPSEAVHIGDIERTDVAGALAVGMRAIRLDQARVSGSSDAELVATTYEEIVQYLLTAEC
jgi:FMN phosphatase YigB (HAD superfamily)